ARLDVYKTNEAVFEENIKILKLDVMLRDNALTELRKKFKKAEKERDDLKLTLEKFENSSKNLSKLLEVQVSDKFKTGLGFDSKVIDSQVNDKIGEGESKSKSVSEPLIEDWIFDSEDEIETKSKQRKPSFAKVEFVKSKEHVKSHRESVKKVEKSKQDEHPRKNSQSHRGIFVPKAVLMKSGLKALTTARQNSSEAEVSVNTARPINTAFPRPTVNYAKPASNVFNRAHSQVRSPFNKCTTKRNSNFNENFNTVKGNVTTAGPKAVASKNKGNEANAVKASACWIWKPKKKVLDHVSRHNGALMNFKRFDYIDAQGRSKHMTGNRSCLIDYEEINGGFVTFGGSTKGRKITGKDIDCVVLSPDFRLIDESHVLFKVPRKDNMYSIDLKECCIENLIDLKVKVIRCDNETEFKNRAMNQFCEIKSIKREFSVAKTPQQNIVAERKNMTLIEVARTMLADSKLPTTFWAEAVNTACYVQNRVLVIKPHNKTPYELFLGRKPALSFMRPFGCPVGVLSTVITASIEDNVVDENTFYGCADDPNMPNLEEIVYLKDDEGVGAEADMNNLDTFMLVGPIPTTRIHKDHPFEQIIGDLHSAPQTRRMTKSVTEHEPKKVIQALKDPSWIEAMQEELLQFKLQQVWTMVDLPYGKRATGTKWVYKNKKDEKGIVIRNKARLFLAYASFKDFAVYQMDVKSAFMYGMIEEEVYVCQPSGFEDPDFPDRVYKVETTLYGLHQAPRACKYTMEISKPLMKDENAEDKTIHEERGDNVEKAVTIVASLDATHDSGAKIPYWGTGLLKLGFRGCLNSPMIHLLLRVNTLGSGEDRMQLQELMEICTKLSKRVLDLEKIKDAQALDIQKLKTRVKKLEKKKKSRTLQLKKRLFKVRIESSVDKSLGDQEDASKHGRNEIDLDEGTSFVQEDAETQGRYGHDIDVTTI
ncbi:retrovirus-related pol polyprotein from transposon TNT 1-94, partial [Tanacetum coccineum]